jgi:carboxypeptidase Taq
VKRTFDTDGLRRLSLRVMRDLGFDMKAGRLDLAEHPFSSGIATGDTRITTHLLPDNLLASLGAVTHEAGHGMYEQGLPAAWAGTGLNRAAGYGMHESQSRFWENFIGRSLPFCRYAVARMQGIWPDLELGAEQLYGAANRVERSLIRIFADEATYNLHIIVRFEVELGILEGALEARDLPEAWDAAYRRVVGVVSRSARDGVLQDVHWSSGLFGYFPSYTIGNLYAASLGATLQDALPDLWAQVERGEFREILGWLRKHIHARGAYADAPEILRAAVGDRDPVEDLVAHLWRRQGAVYGVSRPR